MNLPNDSRVWVFQSSREFTPSEIKVIKNSLELFLKDWNAHGSALLGDYELPYDQFIVVGVNESYTGASGCSIDKLTGLIRKLDAQFNLDLLDRMKTAYAIGPEIKTVPLSTFKQLVKSGELDHDTIVFNNGVANFEQFNSAWQLPLEESWAKNLIPASI